MQRVLVVEDDADLRLLVVQVLELAGFEVLHLSDFACAGALLDRQSVDLVIADLPEGGHLDAVRHLSVRERGVPLLICTGCPKAGAMDPGELGAAEIIMKPYEMEALLKAARTYCLEGSGSAAAVGRASWGYEGSSP